MYWLVNQMIFTASTFTEDKEDVVIHTKHINRIYGRRSPVPVSSMLQKRDQKKWNNNSSLSLQRCRK